jgi:hypothetical protein
LTGGHSGAQSQRPLYSFGRLFRPRRVFAAWLLLAALFAGEVADAHHHLSEHGCAAETGGRDDNCTCASLHASSIASEPPAQAPPVARLCEFSPPAPAGVRCYCAASSCAPRAPPRA